MTELNFDAKLSAGELYAFSMRHTYSRLCFGARQKHRSEKIKA